GVIADKFMTLQSSFSSSGAAGLFSKVIKTVSSSKFMLPVILASTAGLGIKKLLGKRKDKDDDYYGEEPKKEGLLSNLLGLASGMVNVTAKSIGGLFGFGKGDDKFTEDELRNPEYKGEVMKSSKSKPAMLSAKETKEFSANADASDSMLNGDLSNIDVKRSGLGSTRELVSDSTMSNKITGGMSLSMLPNPLKSLF